MTISSGKIGCPKIKLLQNYDMLIAISWFVIILLLKFHILNLPYHWDELGAYIQPTHWLAQGSLFRVLPGFHPPYMFYGHPPGIYLSLASIYKIFGESIWISHMYVIAIAFLGVYFVYLLGKQLCNRFVGIWASVLLFFSPIYFSQSGMVTGDIVMTSFALMTLYYLFKRKYIPYLLSGFCLVMIKESSLAIIVAAIIYLYITEKESPQVRTIMFKYAVPILPIIIFFILQKISTGVFLPNRGFISNDFICFDVISIYAKLTEVVKWIFYNQYRWVLTSIILICFLIKRKIFYKKELIVYLLITIFTTLAFSFIYFLPRYILSVLPLLCIVSALAIETLFNNRKLQILSVALILYLFVGAFYGDGKGRGSFENNMEYLDVVYTHKEACKYIENNYSNKKIFALWPLNQGLANPYLGYVDKPIITTSPKKPCDVYVYSPQSDLEKEKLEESMKLRNLKLEKKFEKNGKYVEIYISNPILLQN